MSSLPLVDQQAEALRRTTGLSVGSYCGADGVDDWDEERWRSEISAHQVLVLIHQVTVIVVSKMESKLELSPAGVSGYSDPCLLQNI